MEQARKACHGGLSWEAKASSEHWDPAGSSAREKRDFSKDRAEGKAMTEYLDLPIYPLLMHQWEYTVGHGWGWQARIVRQTSMFI